MAERYDIILFGVTGFTGQLAAAWFDAHAPEGLTWAIAARSADKLQAVADGLRRDPPQIIADSSDPASIDVMVQQARVLLTTVGPFAKYGSAVVAACVAHKTHYVDITGETHWVADMIDAHHAQAAADGTRIVPFCGFDSVPSDLGAWMMTDWIRRTWGQGTRHVIAGFSITGGLNGGTLDTTLTALENGEGKRLGHTQLLNPPDYRPPEERAASADFARVAWSDALERWTAPFLMASVNTRVVRRSNGLLHVWGDPAAYGDHFVYEERMMLRSRWRATMVWASFVAGVMALQTRAGRALARRLGPAPGEGPSQDAIDNGFCKAHLVATADDGRTVRGRFQYAGDPGNAATVLMVCCSALTLALDEAALPGGPERGGVLTPATAMGSALLDRLRAHDMMFQVEVP